jgi:hypothetical protein
MAAARAERTTREPGRSSVFPDARLENPLAKGRPKARGTGAEAEEYEEVGGLNRSDEAG